jgi:hypothetical protein
MTFIRKSATIALSGLLLLSGGPVFATSVTSGSINTGAPSGDTAQEPNASVAAGTYSAVQSVTLTAGSGASIRYTTNGTVPNCSGTGTVYSGAISVGSSLTLKAIACYSGTPSNVNSFIYVINLPPSAPVISPAGGVYTSAQSVSISSSGSNSIRYTTDGTTPACNSGTTYAGAFVISSSATVKAIGCNSGTPSTVSSASYTINISTGGGGGGGGSSGGGGGSGYTSSAPTGFQIYWNGRYWTQAEYDAATKPGASPVVPVPSMPSTVQPPPFQGPPTTTTSVNKPKPPVLPVFKRNLYSGAIGNDVQNLQIFLNTHGFEIAKTGSGSRGKETQKFGTLTRDAVRKFQLKYLKEMLGPNAKPSQATGGFGPATRAFVNKMLSQGK